MNREPKSKKERREEADKKQFEEFMQRFCKRREEAGMVVPEKYRTIPGQLSISLVGIFS